MNVFDLLKFFESKVDEHYANRKQTEHYYSLIREQINILQTPLVPVRDVYKTLTQEKKCNFTYQYFNKIVEKQWKVVVFGGKRHIVVSSECDRLCSW